MPIERRKSALPWLTELSKYLDKKNDRLDCPIGHCKSLIFRLITFDNLLILLLVKECDYTHSTHVGWRILGNLVTFLVGKSCVKCDEM